MRLQRLEHRFAAREVDPERAVLGVARSSGSTSDAVMFALHVDIGVAEHLREIVVDRADGPVDVEFDDRLRLADGGELAFVVRGAQLLLGDVGGVFDHLE